MKKFCLVLCLAALWLVSLPVMAAIDFRIVALFPGKAMIEQNGNSFVLSVGKSKNRMTLLDTDTYAQTATIEIDGKAEVYEIGRHVGGGYATPEKRETRILMNNRGSFVTNGSINGQSVYFLVDTGASSITMNASLARRLGIDYETKGQPVLVNTASGRETGRAVKLDSASVGPIQVSNVRAIVLENEGLSMTLLGMSFLSQIEIENRANMMVLRQSN
ncbi:MAG: TIGR02281 family clan AA aspartic protease [Chromatiales bacterium]|jgi:aspartyl protease family protein